MIEVRNVAFAYASGPPVIRNVSLNLARGAMAALIGANGCGKSTLIRLIAGLLAPLEGEVRVNGIPVSVSEPSTRTRTIAYVPQATARAFPFTALEVVLTGRSPYLPRFSFEGTHDAEKAMDAMTTVGIADLAPRRITELSSGERQLVSLARALTQEPDCLLLDEPSAALDLKHRAELIRILCRLRDGRGLTVLMVTHDLSLLDPGFDVVFAMRHGEMAAIGPPAEALRESVLADVYADEHVRVRRIDGRTFVWSEV